MAGAPWSLLEKAILVYYDGKRIYHNDLCKLILQHARTKRTLMGVRSKLAELKKKQSLYDKQLNAWTSSATHIAAGTWSATQKTRPIHLTRTAELERAGIPLETTRENRSTRRCTAAC